MTLKLLPSSPSPPPFSWSSLPAASNSPPNASSLPSPPTSWLSARDMKMFGAQPLKSDIGVVKCKECGKPVLKSAIGEHADNCARIRALAKKGAKGKAAAESEDALAKKNGKKRKADDVSPDAEDPSQPLKKKPKALKTGRVKGPINYDKNCCVINDKNLPCSRSLTCKTHSMGAKRAVQGRSKPYDELLLDWHRANNPNFVEPTKRESKKEKKEKREREKGEKKKREREEALAAGIDITKKGFSSSATKKQGKKAAAAAAALAAAVEGGDGEENLADIDSEAEVDSLVKAVRHARARGVVGMPLAVPGDAGSWFVGRRERLRNCRELLAGALGVGGAVNGRTLGIGNGGIGVGIGVGGGATRLA